MNLNVTHLYRLHGSITRYFMILATPLSNSVHVLFFEAN